MTLPERLRQLREERYLSQADLARLSGLHKLTVHRIEKGTTVPYARTVRALAKALGVSPQDLASPDEVAGRKKG